MSTFHKRYWIRRFDARRTVLAATSDLTEARRSAKFFGDGAEVFELYDAKLQTRVDVFGGAS